jgi:fatty acid desaturase
MEENNKKTNKKTILDWVVAAVVIIALVICYFFWGCTKDLAVTILAGVLLVAGTVLIQVQNHKIKKACEE